MNRSVLFSAVRSPEYFETFFARVYPKDTAQSRCYAGRDLAESTLYSGTQINVKYQPYA